MSFTKVLISVSFLLLSASLYAAKPEKILVCHVGSDKGSADQTYMENPDCDEPVGWDAEADGEFRCPDAGKIDLILVSAKANHLGNESHTYGGFSDYVPLDGAGSEAGDFEDGIPLDGIDKGCELEVEANLLCPCWNSYTPSGFGLLLDGWYADDLETYVEHCTAGASEADIQWRKISDDALTIITVQDSLEPWCYAIRRNIATSDISTEYLSQDELSICLAELEAVQSVAAACNAAL